MLKKVLFPVFVLSILSNTSQAQRFLGVATGQYLPTKAVYLNPALIANTSLKWSVDIASVNGLLNQNYGTINLRGVNDLIANGDPIKVTSIDKVLNKGSNDKFDLVGALDINILNAYASYKNKHHFGFNFRMRSTANVKNYDTKFFSSLLASGAGSTPLNVADMRLNIHSWNELGFSYATKIWEDEKGVFAFGGSLKYLSGLSYMAININDIQGNIEGSTGIGSKGFIDANALNIAASTYSREAGNGLSAGFGDRLKSMFNGNASGLGLDVGLTYDIKQNTPSKNNKETKNEKVVTNSAQYKWRFSAALTDFGFMSFKNTTNLSANGSGSLSIDSISDNFDQFDQFSNYLDSKGVNVQFKERSAKQSIFLPTSIVLSADYNIDNSFFVNAMFIHGFSPAQKSFSPSVGSQLSVVPRFENKLFTVGLPLTYSFFTNSFKMGFGVRVSGFYFGMDDALVMMGSKKALGANVYIGGQIPIATSKK